MCRALLRMFERTMLTSGRANQRPTYEASCTCPPSRSEPVTAGAHAASGARMRFLGRTSSCSL